MSTQSARLLGTLAKEMNLAEPELIETFHKKIPDQKQRSKTLLAFLHKYGEVPKSKLIVLQRTMRAALEVTSDAGEAGAKTAPPRRPKKPASAEQKAAREPEAADPEERRATPVATRSVEEVRAIAQAAAAGSESVVPTRSAGRRRKTASGIKRKSGAALKRKTGGARGVKRKTGPALKTEGGEESVAEAAAPKRPGALLIGVAAAAVIVIIIAGAFLLLPDGRVTEAMARAEAALKQDRLEEAFEALAPFTDEELVNGGLALRLKIKERSIDQARAIEAQVARMVDRKNLSDAQKCLQLGRDQMLASDFQALQDKLGRQIDIALKIQKVGELAGSQDFLAALDTLSSIPADQLPEGSRTLAQELADQQRAAVLAALATAEEEAFKGESGAAAMARAEAMGGPAFAEDCARVRRGLAGIRGEAAAAAQVRDHLKKQEPELALSLINSRFRYARDLPGFKTLHTKTLASLRASLAADEKSKGPQAAWARLAAAGAIDRYPLLREARAALLDTLREQERARLASLVDAGEYARAAEALKAVALRPWSFPEERLEKIRKYIADASKIKAYLAEQKRFEAQISNLRAAYKDIDFAAIDKALTGRWTAPSVLAFIQIEKRVRGEFEALLARSLEGFDSRKGQEISVKLKSSQIRARLTGVSRDQLSLSFKIGGGAASYKLRDLDWDEVLKYAKYGAEKDRLGYRKAIALYARGEAAEAALEEFRTEFLARDILALLRRDPKDAAGLGPNPLADPDAIPGIPDPIANGEDKAEEPEEELLPPRPADPKPADPKPADPFIPEPGIDPAATAEVDKIAELVNKQELYLAEALAGELLKKYPNNPRVHGYMSRIHYRLGRFEDCRKSLAIAAEGSPFWKDEQRNKEALIEFLYGNDDKVKAILKTIETRDPGVTHMEELMAPRGLEKSRSREGHYLVYCEPVLAAKGGDKYAARALELIYDTYAKVFPFPRDEKVVYRCYILSKSYKYQAFAKTIGHDATGTKGFFAPTERILVIDADARGAASNQAGFTAGNLRTIFHEAFHQFVNIYVPDIPLWFNEGLADYFGTAQFASKKKLILGKFPRYEPGERTRYEVINEAVRDPQEAGIEPLDLESFIRQTDAEFRAEPTREGMNYAQGWSFVHFLLHNKQIGKTGRKLIKEYFKLFKEGRGRDVAFQETFGKVDLAKLEAAWRLHVKTM